MDGFFSAYSALEARMKVVDVIANNLANAQTTGFKRDFGQMLQNESGFDMRSHVDLSPGDLIMTGNELDAAIDGQGFFAVQTPNGVRYTRAGSFIVNSHGDLVTKDGMKVLSTGNNPISSTDGTMAVQDNGSVTVEGNEVATLKIVNFADPSKLLKEGFDRFQWSGPEGQVAALSEPRLKGGHLERSNVNVVTEMVQLMSAYREFEAVQRTVKTLMTD